MKENIPLPVSSFQEEKPSRTFVLVIAQKREISSKSRKRAATLKYAANTGVTCIVLHASMISPYSALPRRNYKLHKM